MPMNTTPDGVPMALEGCGDAFDALLARLMQAGLEKRMAEMRLAEENSRLREEIGEWKIRCRELEIKSSCTSQGLISGQSNTLLPTNETQKPDSNSRESQLEAENKRLKEEVIRLKRQIEDNQNEEIVKETAWHDKVRLELLLRLLENDGTDMQDVVKARVAEVLRVITKLPISTCKNYCTNRDLNIKVHEEEILKLNSILQAIGMEIRL